MNYILIETIIGAVLAVIIAIVTYKPQIEFYIGQKVYYYVLDQDKKCAGRIKATILCQREEDVDMNESRRIIPHNKRKTKRSEYLLLEIQPILGGQRIIIPSTNVLEKVGD